MDSLLGRWGPHLEVLGVHVELVAVQLAQLGKGGLDVIEVLDGFSEGGHDHLAVRLDPGVAHDGGRAGEVAKLSKEPLAPGVHHQQSRVAASPGVGLHRPGRRPQIAALSLPLPLSLCL
uniref:Uncharacterized protein n=1 Tax=Podarcis muralis TaxID=64176 RepID=A0A670ID07_PODMU